MIATSTEPTLQRLRMSAFWHQTLLPDKPQARPEVLDRSAYQALFNTARGAQKGSLTVPWPAHERQGFWERYLPRWPSLAAVPGREAWRLLVPLRSASPLRIDAGEGISATSEGFLHPWGATFLVTFRIDVEWPSLGDAVEALNELHRAACLELPDAQPGRKLRLDDAAGVGLAALGSLAVNSEAGPWRDGFSTVTVMAAKGERALFDPTAALTTKFLHAASSFSETWEEDTPPTLAEAKVAGKRTAPPSHLVYGDGRGRVIWSPERFRKGSPSQSPSTLSCHHRNLVLASIQTEATGRFVELTAERAAHGIQLSSEHLTQAGWAVRILRDLHAGSTSTYRSGSPRAQIEQNGWLTPIATVAELAGVP